MLEYHSRLAHLSNVHTRIAADTRPSICSLREAAPRLLRMPNTCTAPTHTRTHPNGGHEFGPHTCMFFSQHLDLSVLPRPAFATVVCQRPPPAPSPRARRRDTTATTTRKSTRNCAVLFGGARCQYALEHAAHPCPADVAAAVDAPTVLIYPRVCAREREG